LGAIDNFVNLDGARAAWGLVLIASTLRDCPNRGSFGATLPSGSCHTGARHPGGGYRVGGGGNGGYYGHNHDYGGYDACALNPFYLLNPGYPYSC
jgi:hypothetical protein